MSSEFPQSNVYVGANAILLTYGETRQRIECDWVYWPQQSPSDPYTVSRSGSNLCASSHNRGRKTKL